MGQYIPLDGIRGRRNAAFLGRGLALASIVMAVVPDFGQGTLLLAALALGGGVGSWWAASAQAHGHAQLFGWAALMVLAVGMHVVPRLRGMPLALPHLFGWVIVLAGGGVAARTILQPALALLAPGAPLAARAALALTGAAELAGTTLAIAILARTLGSGPPLAQRGGSWRPGRSWRLRWRLCGWGAWAMRLGRRGCCGQD